MREILKSHPVANLRAEMKKFKSSLNYGKLKKAELIDLMMKHQDQFKHIKMYVKPEPKAKPAAKAKPKSDEFKEISMEGNIYFIQGKKVLNELGNETTGDLKNKVLKYNTDKAFKKKIKAEYKKELDKRIKETKRKDKERLKK